MLQSATLRELQQRIDEMQPLRLDERALPTHPALARLLPEATLRRGSSYTVRGSQSLALSLLAQASSSGLWCAAIGCAGFGAEAAAALGIALDRCVLVPDPGDHELALLGLLSEAFTVVVLRSSSRVRPGEAERVAARLREHGAALVVMGEWPRPESALSVTASRWSGLGQGAGMLDARELTVRSQDRRGSRLHTVRFSHDGISSVSGPPEPAQIPQPVSEAGPAQSPTRSAARELVAL